MAQTTGSGCAAIIARPNQQSAGANLAGFTPWGGTSGWTRDISADPVDPYSSAWITTIQAGGTPALFADQVVKTMVVTGQTRQAIPITSYPNISEAGPYPIPMPPLIEGVTTDYTVAGDKHLTIIDKDSCLLFEAWNTHYDPITNTISASSGAVYDLLSGDHQRPYLWAGSSVSGLPWAWNVVRYDEVASGKINHAITFAAVGRGRSAFTDMASSAQYGVGNIATMPPMGARARLKAGYDISGFSPRIQVILKALKQYGMVYVDGSMPVDVGFEVDDRWDSTELRQLRSVLFNATNFEFVKAGPIYTDPMYGTATAPPKGPAPVIGSFTASSVNVAAGTPVTLSWSVTGAGSRVRVITPNVGPVVTNSVVVTPSATTTYTLQVENQYGVSRSNVTVNVAAGSCVAGVPAVTASPASANLVAGQTASYIVSVTNTDSGCAAETFSLTHTLPFGWTGTYSPATLTIPPGTSATATLTVTPPANGVAGSNTITVAVSGMAGTASASATASFTPIQGVSLAISPVAVVGSKSATGTVTLVNPAPSGGAVVSLASSSASAAVPASVTIAAGATTATFAITTTPVAAATSAAISATYGGIVRTATLNVAPAALALVSIHPSSMGGGASSAGNSVVMSGAVAAATTVYLSSANPALATVPASVTVPAGASSANFTITSTPVGASTVVAVAGTCGGVTKTANLTLQPLALYDVQLSPTTAAGGAVTTLNKVVLNAPAVVNTAVAVASSNPAVASVPAQVVVPAGASSAAFSITTTGVAAQTPVNISATYGGATTTKTLTVVPVALSALSLASNPVAGGLAASYCTVSLNGPAGPAGVVVTLATANAAVAAPPATVTVPAGATRSAYFAIPTSYVSATTSVAISATYGAVTKTVNLTVNPPALSSMTLGPNPSVGGATATSNSVSLNAPAGPAGAVVMLASSNPALAAVPASVTVAAGATKSPTFSVATAYVTASTTVAITATYAGVSKTVSLTLNPLALSSVGVWPSTVTGGASAVSNRVTLNGPAPAGGVVVALTSSNPLVAAVPASITVPAGATASAYFTIATKPVTATTTVTVTASYGGVSKTATLTVNP